MRHIDRTEVPAPVVLTGENRKGPKESRRAKQKAKELLDQNSNLEGYEFNHRAYKDKGVVDALYRLFDGKCAYCESRYAGTQPMDVEHWRPKGKALREGLDDMRPGYYWLAAKWENLLPSCIDCNRARRQKIPFTEEEVVIGKANQFPVFNEETRCLDHTQDMDAEAPVLLDPCKGQDTPEMFLAFNDEGIVLPHQRLDDADTADEVIRNDRRRAVDSIRVYALNRSGLVIARQEVLRIIEFHKVTVIKLMEVQARLLQIQESGGQEINNELVDVISIVDELIEMHLQHLREMTRPDQVFSLMAEQVIDEFLADLSARSPISITQAEPGNTQPAGEGAAG